MYAIDNDSDVNYLIVEPYNSFVTDCDSHKVCSMGTSNILSLLLILNTVLAQTNKTCWYSDWACGDQCISFNGEYKLYVTHVFMFRLYI